MQFLARQLLAPGSLSLLLIIASVSDETNYLKKAMVMSNDRNLHQFQMKLIDNCISFK